MNVQEFQNKLKEVQGNCQTTWECVKCSRNTSGI